MKIFATTMALTLVIFAYSATADDFEHSVSLKATVPTYCQSGDPTPENQTGLGFATNPSAAQSTFNITISGGVAEATEGTLKFSNFVCNARLQVNISNGRSLTNAKVGAGQGGDLSREIPYKVSFMYNDMGYEYEQPIPQYFYIPPSLNSTEVVLKIKIEDDGNVLVAGDYKDTLTLHFSPQI